MKMNELPIDATKMNLKSIMRIKKLSMKDNMKLQEIKSTVIEKANQWWPGFRMWCDNINLKGA